MLSSQSDAGAMEGVSFVMLVIVLLFVVVNLGDRFGLNGLDGSI